MHRLQHRVVGVTFSVGLLLSTAGAFASPQVDHSAVSNGGADSIVAPVLVSKHPVVPVDALNKLPGSRGTAGGGSAAVPAAAPVVAPAAAPASPNSTAPAVSGDKPAESEGAAKTQQPGDDASRSIFFKEKKPERGTPPCLAWVDPDREPRIVLLCVHGCGLHNGTWEAFGKRMAARGIATYAVDVRGFGSWVRKQGKENIDFDGCIRDVHDTLDVIHKVHPTLPVYIIGESMGGAIALRVASMYPEKVAGLISSVPAGDRFNSLATDLRVAGRLLLGPNRKFDIGTMIIDMATQKDSLKKEWGGDPLAKLQLSPKELVQFDFFCNGNKKAAAELKSIPVLFVQGCDDKLIKPQSTFEIFDRLATPDKQIIAIKGQEHLIFEENQFNDAIIDMVVDWLEKPLPKHLANPKTSVAKEYAEQNKPKKQKRNSSDPADPLEVVPANMSTPEARPTSSQPSNPRPAQTNPYNPQPAANFNPNRPLTPEEERARANAAADAAAAAAFKKMMQQNQR